MLIYILYVPVYLNKMKTNNQETVPVEKFQYLTENKRTLAYLKGNAENKPRLAKELHLL